MRRFWSLPLLALASASLAHAADVVVLSDLPERVVANQAIILSWVAPPGDAREAELELSLDNRHWVRISPQFDACERSWSWRVPDVAADRARLRLRVGGEEREDVVAVSREFRIEGASARVGSSREPAPEWWRRLGPEGANGPASMGVDLPALTCALKNPQAECHPSLSLRVPASGVRIPLENGSFVSVASGSTTDVTAPRFVPLRN